MTEALQPSGSDSRPADAVLADAIALHRADRLREAEPLYAAVLAAQPDHPDALHFLGVLKHRQGASDEAVALISRALALAPSPDAHNNLGNVLLQTGRAAEAVAAYRRVVELRPDDAAAHHNLGIALQGIDQPVEAAIALERAITLEPRQALFHYSSAMLWLRRGRPDMALPLVQVALALDSNFSQAHLARIRAIRMVGNEPAAALRAITDWLAREPDNPVAQHFRAVYSGDVPPPPRASDAFVRNLFDKYAASFDAHLGRLGYRAPQLLQAAVAQAVGEPMAALDVLDAGCGTGLCGPLLRPFARRLVGVDLAEAMLAKARERDIYDELSAGELTAFIAARPRSYDVIVSADTLVYFGDLGAVAHAAAAALRDGGVLAFSVERCAEAGNLGYRLEDHGRFSHHPDYVRRVLTDAGLAVSRIDAATPRNEGGVPVAGLVVVARKPSG
jgi:predicted TPR repeat methyltransferase